MTSAHRPAVPAPDAPPQGRRRGPGAAAFLSACLLLGPAPAGAQAGAACDPAGDPQQVAACAVRDFQSADIRLNIRYREAMEAVAADRRVALRQEQRGWLRTRDSGCKAETRAHEGAAAWPRLYHACLERATVRRTTELDRPDRSAPP